MGHRVAQMMEKHTNPAVRAGLAKHFRRTPWLIETLRKLARSDADPDVRSVALRRLLDVMPKLSSDEVCDLIADAAEDSNMEMARPDTSLFATTPGCYKQSYRVLSAMEKNTKAGRTISIYDVMRIWRKDQLTVTAKRQAVSTAKAIVMNTSNQQRQEALRFVASHDPTGKLFARAFLEDSDRKVAGLARVIVEGR